MNYLHCPYCGYGYQISYEDGWGLEEDKVYHDKCPICGKNFVFDTYFEIHHETSKADCLNGAEHDYVVKYRYSLDGKQEIQQCRVCGFEKSQEINNDILVE